MKRSLLKALTIILTGLSAASLGPASAIGGELVSKGGTVLTPSGHSHVTSRRAGSGYVRQSVSYPPAIYAGYQRPVLGDGSTPYGGIAPAADDEPDIPSNFDTSAWYSTGSKTLADGREAKFRTHCNYSHHAYEDPIIYPGQRGVSHLHTFFGNTLMGATSTYASLRTAGGSTCGAGPINRSGYWYPSVLKDNATGDGKTKVVRPGYAIVYYNVGKSRADTNRISPIPRGLTYVFGFNPADPGDGMQQSEVKAANIGASGMTYSYKSNGFEGWKCEASNGSNPNSPVPGSALQPYLRNADGTATLFCSPKEHIGAALSGPQCWDGKNLASPNGRLHVRQYIRNTAGMPDICPEGWYEIAQFELFVWFSHTGESDYKEWYLSSDRMPGLAQFRNGETMHSDWFGAWDYEIMKTWMRECNGTTVDGAAGTARSCNNSQFGDGRRGFVQESAPDNSRSPQINFAPFPAGGRFDPLPEAGR